MSLKLAISNSYVTNYQRVRVKKTYSNSCSETFLGLLLKNCSSSADVRPIGRWHLMIGVALGPARVAFEDHKSGCQWIMASEGLLKTISKTCMKPTRWSPEITKLVYNLVN